jgi:hypothetical protein
MASAALTVSEAVGYAEVHTLQPSSLRCRKTRPRYCPCQAASIGSVSTADAVKQRRSWCGACSDQQSLCFSTSSLEYSK